MQPHQHEMFPKESGNPTTTTVCTVGLEPEVNDNQTEMEGTVELSQNVKDGAHTCLLGHRTIFKERFISLVYIYKG